MHFNKLNEFSVVSVNVLPIGLDWLFPVCGLELYGNFLK